MATAKGQKETVGKADEKQKDATKETAKPQVKEAEYQSKYSIEELAAAARMAFQVPDIVVRAALQEAGKDAYTMADATVIVSAFNEKEVK